MKSLSPPPYKGRILSPDAAAFRRKGPEKIVLGMVQNTKQKTPKMGGSAGNLLCWIRGWGWFLGLGLERLFWGLGAGLPAGIPLGTVWMDPAYLTEKLRSSLLTPEYPKSL